MAFKNEERENGFISVNDILRKEKDEDFENLVGKIKSMSEEERTKLWNDNASKLVSVFSQVFEEQDIFITSLMRFIIESVALSCTGFKSSDVTAQRRKKVGGLFDFLGLAERIESDIEVFDTTFLEKRGLYCDLMQFLTISLQPLTSPYPDLVFTFWLVLSCTDEINEKAINSIRKIRDDYFLFAEAKNDGYTGDFSDLFGEKTY